MPNWFYFSLNVSGKKEDVQAFVENVKGTKEYETEGYEFDFNHFIPQPENIFREPISSDKEKELESMGLPNWYTWNNANWGTKWNASVDDSYVASDKDGFPYEHTYQMRTAWADPRPIIIKMLEMYPHLDFEINGEEESNAYGIYVSSSEDVFLEEEPTMIDEENGREVYYENEKNTWVYMDDDSPVEDSEDFWPINKYSWY
jgi:hypothetical protein